MTKIGYWHRLWKDFACDATWYVQVPDQKPIHVGKFNENFFNSCLPKGYADSALFFSNTLNMDFTAINKHVWENTTV